MKQIITILSFVLISTSIFAQKDDNSAKPDFRKAMSNALDELANADNRDAFQAVSNKFERIAAVNEESWQPAYYLAFTKTIQAFQAKDKVETAAGLDEQLKKLEKILTLESVEDDPEVQSEIHTLIGMIYSAQMSADPMGLGPRLGPLQGKHLGMAERLNSENPRSLLLQAQSQYYTPEAFGGNKKKAKDLLEMSKELFQKEAEMKRKNFMPRWGMEQVNDLNDRMLKEKK